MANKFSISVVISAVDKVSANVKHIQESLQATFKPVNDLQSSFSNLWKAGGGPQVAGAFKKFGDAAGNVKDKFGELIAKVAVFGGAAAFAVAEVVKATYEAGEAINKLSERSGIGAEALQELQYAAIQSDIDIEDFSTGLLTMSKSLGQAQAGTGKLHGLLQKVNPAFGAQLKSVKNNEEAFLMLIGAIGKLKDPQRQMALATAAFGKSGGAFLSLAKQGSSGIEQLRKKAHELGFVMSNDSVQAAAEFEDRIRDVGVALTGVRNTIGSALLPVFREYVTAFTDWISANKENIKAFATAFAQFVKELLPKIMDFAKAFFGFFIAFDEHSKQFTLKTGNIRLAMLAIAAVVVGPLIAALASLASAFVTLGIAIGATPVGWIIAALVGLIAVGTLVWAYWDDIKQFFIDLWNEPIAKFTQFAMFLAKWGVLGIPGLIIANWSTLKDWFTSFFDWLVEKFNTAFEVIKPMLGLITPTGGTLTVASANAGPQAADRALPTSAAATLTNQSPVRSESKIQVDFLNMPKGARVKSDVGDNANLDLGIQYGQMAAVM